MYSFQKHSIKPVSFENSMKRVFFSLFLCFNSSFYWSSRHETRRSQSIRLNCFFLSSVIESGHQFMFFIISPRIHIIWLCDKLMNMWTNTPNSGTLIWTWNRRSSSRLRYYDTNTVLILCPLTVECVIWISSSLRHLQILYHFTQCTHRFLSN